MRIQNSLPSGAYTDSVATLWKWHLRQLDVAVTYADEAVLHLAVLFDNIVMETALAVVLSASLLFFVLRKAFVYYRVELKWHQFLGVLLEELLTVEINVCRIRQLIRSELSSGELSGVLGRRHAFELFKALHLRQDKITIQDMSVIASEIAALGMPLDFGLVQAEVKRHSSGQTAVTTVTSSYSDRVHTPSLVRAMIWHSSRISRLLLCIVQETWDVVVNDPASSLVALCI